MDFHVFMAGMRKQMYVWNMAFGDTRENSGREKRMTSAQDKIELLIEQYWHEKYGEG